MFDQLHISNSSSELLLTGQQLDRKDFERRWDESPQIKYAELIDGIVRVNGPVKATHSRALSCLALWLVRYEMETPGVISCGPASIRLDEFNMPLSDSLLMIDPKRGGRCRISDDDLVEGGPELICEVTNDSRSFDLHAKFKLYERHAVQEYLVWRTLDREIDWFQLCNGRFQRIVPNEGLLKSQVFPGLWLRPDELIQDRLRFVRLTVQQGASSAEHRDFIQRLQQ